MMRFVKKEKEKWKHIAFGEGGRAKKKWLVEGIDPKLSEEGLWALFDIYLQWKPDEVPPQARIARWTDNWQTGKKVKSRIIRCDEPPIAEILNYQYGTLTVRPYLEHSEDAKMRKYKDDTKMINKANLEDMTDDRALEVLEREKDKKRRRQ